MNKLEKAYEVLKTYFTELTSNLDDVYAPKADASNVELSSAMMAAHEYLKSFDYNDVLQMAAQDVVTKHDSLFTLSTRDVVEDIDCFISFYECAA